MTPKKFTLFFFALMVVLSGRSQDFLPALNDNYMGVNQVLLQPASIADSRFKVDINFFGLGGEVSNTLVRFERSALATLNYDDVKNDATYMIGANGKDVNSYMSQTYLAPSFMVTIKEKFALGLTVRARYIASAEGIDEPLARSVYTDFIADEHYPDMDRYWDKWYQDDGFRATSHIFTDYGISFASEVFDYGAHYLKTGITVKLLQGLAGASFNASESYYYLDARGTSGNERVLLSWNSPEVQMGVSDNWNWGSETNDTYPVSFDYNFIGKPSIGLDLGVVYEFRPRWGDYRYTMDGVSDLVRHDQNKYLVKVGISVLDIGRLKYEKYYNSSDFSAAMTPGYMDDPNMAATHWMDANAVEFGFPRWVNLADTVYQRSSSNQGISLDGNDGGTFKVKLPTAVSLQADVLLAKGLYVNLTTFTGLNQSYSKPGQSHYLSTYSVTPRYERKWFGVAVPFSYNQYGQFNVGLGIRAAFLYFGINSIITDVFRDPYGTSVYLGARIPIWHKAPPVDTDGDGISDAKDKCLDTPGLWEFKGCPDSDGDGIPDSDDRCPKDPGPTLTNGCPDKDNDGVIDNVDQCPDQPGPAEFNGCPDTDGDGVRDEIDQCPQTPGPAAANGCPDQDNDGVADKDDVCPDQFGKKEYNGCPFQDSDGDGIMDETDLCPTQPGPASNNGCPMKDTDGDGIMDESDLCPTVAGPAENQGCPWADTDGDGVWDKDDRCPLTPGELANAGCPVIKTEEAQVLKTAFENLEYETGKAVIRSSSFASLDALATLLNDKPGWKLHIAGHTDNVGSEESNMKLSKDRAEAVARYLKGKGLDGSRFIVEWFGETKPIADNSTPDGRQKNRRVEMEIVFD